MRNSSSEFGSYRRGTVTDQQTRLGYLNLFIDITHLLSFCRLPRISEVNENLTHLGLDEKGIGDTPEGFAGRRDEFLIEAILAEYINPLSID